MAAPAGQKRKRAAVLTNVTASERAKQFKEDFYADDGVMLCRFCQHSVSYVRVDTVKDHLKSKKHQSRKAARLAAATPAPRQATMHTMLASKDHRDEFVIDFVKMTECDIPLEKAKKMKPFVVKHCKQHCPILPHFEGCMFHACLQATLPPWRPCCMASQSPSS